MEKTFFIPIFFLLLNSAFSGEWVTEWGDYANTCCSYDTAIKPPFKLKWRVAFNGTMFKTSPIAADGKLFVVSRVGGVMALDAETGALIWRRHFPYAYHRNTATYADGKLFLFKNNTNRNTPYDAATAFEKLGGMFCLDPNTGETVWRKPAGFVSEWDRSGPAYSNGVVCIAYARYPDKMAICMARNAQTGDSLWCMEFPSVGADAAGGNDANSFSHGIAAAGDTFFICINGPAGKVSLAVNAALGPSGVYWQTTAYGMAGPAGRPSYRDGVVLIQQYALRASDGTLLWTAGDAGGLCFTRELLAGSGAQAQHAWGFSGCYMGVVVNGYCFSQPTGYAGGRPGGQWRQEARLLSDLRTPVWAYEFSASTCPHMVPAYGKMYAVSTGDAALYCFEPAGE